MAELRNSWYGFWSEVSSTITTIQIIDIIDILVVAFIFYQIIRLVRETRAMQLVRGIAGIIGLYFVALIMGMTTLSFFIQNILSVGITVVVIVFQPELRRALEHLGRTKWGKIFKGTPEEDLQYHLQEMIDAVSEACGYLSADKVGALMVIEREIKLGEIIKTGTAIDAKPSVEMISNIFFHNAPLHDGAMVIRDGRLSAAGCFLPLSSNMEIGRELGTRHRAALGISEISDAVVVVVSEETGSISVAVDGKLQRKLSVQILHKLLCAKILPQQQEEDQDGKKAIFRRKHK